MGVIGHLIKGGRGKPRESFQEAPWATAVMSASCEQHQRGSHGGGPGGC